MASPPLPTVKMKRLVAFALFIIAGNSVFSQSTDTSLWMPNGNVNAILLRDSLLYVGGDFDQFSPVVGKFVALDSAGAQVMQPFPFVRGKVNCMVKDSLGYIYVGGNFSQVGNYFCHNLFRLTPQGNFDPDFLYEPDNEVFTLTFYEHQLLVGGNFTSIGGFLRGRGASISLLYNSLTNIYADTLLPFDANSDGPIYAIYPDSLSQQLVVGGDFLHIGGGLIAYICKLNLTTGNYIPSGNSFWTAIPQVFGPVRSLAIHNGKIYVAGDFDSFATTIRKGIGVIQLSSGHVDTTGSNHYNAGLNGHVRDMNFIGGKIYIGGNFTLAGGIIRENLACLDYNLNVLSWNPSADGQVYNLERWGSNVLCVGGDFHKVGTDTCYYASLVNLDSAGTVNQWNPKFDGPVYAMMPATNGGKVWAGGDFTGAGGILCKNLVAVNTITKAPNNWRPKVNGPVVTLYADSANLFVYGNFSQINSTTRNQLASFTIATGIMNSFNPGVTGLVRTMASTHSQLLLGGNFTVVGGQSRQNIASVDKNTGVTSIWNPGCSGTVNKIIIDNDKVYVAGFFSQTGGQFRDNLARVSLSTGIADWNWSCNTDNGIYDMDLYNGELVIGGWFQNVAGQPRSYCAKVDTASGNVSSFNPFFSDYIRGFERYNQDLFISGLFLTVSGNAQRPSLCDFDLNNGNFDTWTPVPDVFPVTMQASQNWLYIGGSFHNESYYFHPRLAMLSINWVTGIPVQHISATRELKVFPDPVSDFLNIFIPEEWKGPKLIQVIDVNGKVVKKDNIGEPGGNYFPCDVSGLTSGIYLIRMSDENGKEVSCRIIKE
jgi:hypothetical protein